jgi:hypothetical protein
MALKYSFIYSPIHHFPIATLKFEERKKRGEEEEKENEVFVSSPYHNSIAQLRKTSRP